MLLLKSKCRTFHTFPNCVALQPLSNQDRVGKWPTMQSLRMYLALKYGQLTNTWVAYCREDEGLVSSNNMTRHKGDDKPLLFQPMPPLDLACLRDCQKNAFIIPQNMTARIFGVMHGNKESSNELIIPSSFWFRGFFKIIFITLSFLPFLHVTAIYLAWLYLGGRFFLACNN